MNKTSILCFDRFPVYPLTKFIQKHIPTASLVEEIGSDIVFILPTKDSEENPMKQFEVFFKELDKNLAQLNIATYGLSDTTLEEVCSTKSPKDLLNTHDISSDFPESCQQRERRGNCARKQRTSSKPKFEQGALPSPSSEDQPSDRG